MKKREVDLLIVVNMFLTGFDATTLNTLWVDKNLKMHGLIQAFSRTNRILNSVKTFGNIVCFRDLEKETNDAIALFGDKEANGIVLLKSYEDSVIDVIIPSAKNQDVDRLAKNNWMRDDEIRAYEEECKRTYVPKKYTKYAIQALSCPIRLHTSPDSIKRDT